MDDIQPLVDRVARELGRGVVLEDRRFRLIAHSAHQDGVDALRREAIINRESPRPVREWLLGLGVEEAEEWLRIPANPELGMEPRVCVPVRFEGQLLGHVWIIEREPMSDAQLRAARQAADSVAVSLFRHKMTQQVELGLEREGVRDLMDDSPAVRKQAAVHLLEADLFRSGAQVCVLVCSNPSGQEIFDEAARANLDRALQRVRMSLQRRDMLYLIRPDHALALVAVNHVQVPSPTMAQLAERLRSRLDAAFPDEPERGMVVTWGSVQDAPEHARESYDEALQAARVAHAFPSVGRMVSWEDLGVYRLLGQLSQPELDPRILHAGVVAVLSGRHGSDRLRLLETYLDSGGDAVATAAELGIHRATVYYRLGRLEEDMGVSLSNGLERLAVHLSVKLIRLADLAPAVTATHP